MSTDKKNALKSFLDKKNINISAKVYFVDAMGGMAQGLFASLLIGTILSTIAKYLGMTNIGVLVTMAHFLGSAGKMASLITGAAIGVGIASALKAPMLVMACSAAVGYFANAYPGQPYAAGPLGVFVAVIFAVEFGKFVSKETKVDILVTPIVTLGVGYLVAYLTCPAIAVAMNWLGELSTSLRRFIRSRWASSCRLWSESSLHFRYQARPYVLQSVLPELRAARLSPAAAPRWSALQSHRSVITSGAAWYLRA